jgi:hypothetical protein
LMKNLNTRLLKKVLKKKQRVKRKSLKRVGGPLRLRAVNFEV